MLNEASRTVVLGEVPEAQAVGQLGAEKELSASEVEQAVVKFSADSYASFRAEWGVVDGDIVIHFYLPEDAGDLSTAHPSRTVSWQRYWLETFPNVLSPTAQDYFLATRPRLVAKYTEEVGSWWFRARGFGQALSVKDLVTGFLQKLDSALRADS
jgi:hypothetical protein